MDKSLVISDTHLRRGFDRKKCEILRKLINECDKLIIVGDFYEEYATTFYDFVHSKWAELFPLMLEKETVCVLGNHDPNLQSEAYGYFCTDVVERYEMESGGTKFTFIHGHCFDRDASSPSRVPRMMRAVLSSMAKLGCAITGQRSLIIYKWLNSRIKHWKKRYMLSKDWLVTGHTHWAEVDYSARYANPGLFLSSRIYSYLIIENGAVTLRYGRDEPR